MKCVRYITVTYALESEHVRIRKEDFPLDQLVFRGIEGCFAGGVLRPPEGPKLPVTVRDVTLFVEPEDDCPVHTGVVTAAVPRRASRPPKPEGGQ